MIEIKKITKQISNDLILKDISLECPRNSIYTLLGPNGVGKTTLLRCILGLYSIQNGEIYLDNNLVDYKTFSTPSNVGVFLEDARMYSYLSVEENLKYYASFYGKNISDSEISVLIKNIGLNKYLPMKYHKLSTGNKRKCGIIRSLINNPDIIFWDEPFASLDPESILEIKNIINFLKDSKKTLLLTSNDLHNIELLYDKVGFLYSNDLLLEYSANTLKDKYPKASLEELYFKHKKGDIHHD